MGIFSFFRRKPKRGVSILNEDLDHLATASGQVFESAYKDILRNFDDYITAAEAESESLSIELDDNLDQQERIRKVLKNLDKPDSWQERHYLLKLDRLSLHGDNLRSRVEIYSQNIKVYLNLISKVQDIRAMKLHGLDESKIEHIWLEFKKSVEEYKSKLSTEESGYDNDVLTTAALEGRLKVLKEDILNSGGKKTPLGLNRLVVERATFPRGELESHIGKRDETFHAEMESDSSSEERLACE